MANGSSDPNWNDRASLLTSTKRRKKCAELFPGISPCVGFSAQKEQT